METRNTIRVNFVKVPSELKELVSKVPGNSRFSERHGHLLDLVTSGFEEEMMSVLFQFFDPERHCFTFPDYQLVPTMEEFSETLQIPIGNQLPFTGLEKSPKPEAIAAALHLRKSEIEKNWETRSGVEGFLAKFLIDKARSFSKSMSYHAFEDILALLIYGLVLFPNPDQFIDVHAIKIFLTHNPVPTLLGDILHSLHTRTMKKRGTLMCCIPLLSRWFISHLPRSVMRNDQGQKWHRRIMSLSHSDIRWCSLSKENVVIIDRCGRYPNVPLLGIRGGITYNPSLALRQFGYARRDGIHHMLIQGIVFNYEEDPQGHRQKFIRAWDMVNRIDSKSLGPVIVEPEYEEDVPQVISHPDMPTDIEELKRSWIQLKEERDTFEAQFRAKEKKVLELTKQLQDEQSINTFLGAKRQRPWET
ncbi:uncharacterized protein LOC131630838 [Vicia villosa]|uniref:uncharacterized protein LOC131630838 n=2 Tax=Vicia villosa TaxID=3911 RepID=UPI00273B1513|nr:uncharacterized protein LOC131630838 [Vicia villosa]